MRFEWTIWKAIQEVITNLLISHIELRSEESIDIQKYNNNRQVNKYVLALNNELVNAKKVFSNVRLFDLRF